jgi:hypothetical protein
MPCGQNCLYQFNIDKNMAKVFNLYRLLGGVVVGSEDGFGM